VTKLRTMRYLRASKKERGRMLDEKDETLTSWTPRRGSRTPRSSDARVRFGGARNRHRPGSRGGDVRVHQRDSVPGQDRGVSQPRCREARRDARVVVAPSTDVAAVSSSSVDVVFCSNLLEHLPSKADVLQTLVECGRMLRAGGTLIVLQPNIRYLLGRYWDYFDHQTPLTHQSMAEALRLSGFVPKRIEPKFLPYTVKGSRLPRSLTLLSLYLRLPPLWRLLGRQMLIVASRPA
jgi:SAM-dependent methyltransferase